MRYFISFSYDGTNYNGYQKQPKVKTIQGEIEKALKKINSGKAITIHASGRTDAGVHAYNQKAHFDIETKMSPEQIKKSLNSLIPDDIYIKSINKVTEDFHARYNVTAKEYVYEINMGPYNPIKKNYEYQYNKRLDVPEMERALKYLEGEHNFKSFTKASEEKEDYTRRIIQTVLTRDTKDLNHITISFLGTGFLRYMVRNMVGLLIEVGQGKIKSEEVIDILKAEDRTKSGVCAPSCGLYLKDVYY